VIVAERLEAGEHLVDLLLPGDEGGERVLVGLSYLVPGLGAHGRAPLGVLGGAHECFFHGDHQEEKRAPAKIKCLMYKR
jgi:hypothetical protein